MSHARVTRGGRRVPLNSFGMPFGLVGLAATWRQLDQGGHAPAAVAEVLFVVAGVSWLLMLAAYARYVGGSVTTLLGDVTDPVAGPFASLALITPLLLAAQWLYPHLPAFGAVVTLVLIGLTVLLGGWYTGQWIYTPVGVGTFHPGYFLPTVAGGLVASAAAARIGQPGLAYMLLGLGSICWLVLGSIILGRLILGPALPAPLLPTLAIEVAPAAVASLAWFALNGGQVDGVARWLGGYGLLMVIAQLRLLPVFLRLPFMPSTWGFTFSWAAVATATLHWLQQHGVASAALQYAVTAAVTALVGGIAVRTLIALFRHELFPAPVVPPAKQQVAAPGTQALSTHRGESA
jgi:tellurite resistance protein